MMAGMVKAPGAHLLHQEKLASREFYDVWILIEEISVFETRFRAIKR